MFVKGRESPFGIPPLGLLCRASLHSMQSGVASPPPLTPAVLDLAPDLMCPAQRLRRGWLGLCLQAVRVQLVKCACAAEGLGQTQKVHHRCLRSVSDTSWAVVSDEDRAAGKGRGGLACLVLGCWVWVQMEVIFSVEAASVGNAIHPPLVALELATLAAMSV